MTMKTNVTLTGDASHVVRVNFPRQGPIWGRVRWYFELVAHVDSVVVFGKRQWLKVSSNEKASRSLTKEGRKAMINENQTNKMQLKQSVKDKARQKK